MPNVEKQKTNKLGWAEPHSRSHLGFPPFFPFQILTTCCPFKILTPSLNSPYTFDPLKLKSQKYCDPWKLCSNFKICISNHHTLWLQNVGKNNNNNKNMTPQPNIPSTNMSPKNFEASNILTLRKYWPQKPNKTMLDFSKHI